MNRSINALLLISSLTSLSQAMELGDDAKVETKSIGQKYFEYLNRIDKEGAAHGSEILSPSVKQSINSKLIGNNREEVIVELQDFVRRFGIKNVQLLELIIGSNPRKNVIYFEITDYNLLARTMMCILTSDDNGLIKEIKQVWGKKDL